MRLDDAATAAAAFPSSARTRSSSRMGMDGYVAVGSCGAHDLMNSNSLPARISHTWHLRARERECRSVAARFAKPFRSLALLFTAQCAVLSAPRPAVEFSLANVVLRSRSLRQRLPSTVRREQVPMSDHRLVRSVKSSLTPTSRALLSPHPSTSESRGRPIQLRGLKQNLRPLRFHSRPLDRSLAPPLTPTPTPGPHHARMRHAQLPSLAASQIFKVRARCAFFFYMHSWVAIGTYFFNTTDRHGEYRSPL